MGLFTFRPKAITAGGSQPQQAIDYDFRALNLSDYRLELVLPMDNKFFLKLFQDAKNAVMAKKPGLKATLEDSNIENIERFAVDSKYLNLIKTFIKPQLKNVSRIVAEDGVTVLNETVKSVIFQKKEGGQAWMIVVGVEGQYAKK